VTPASKRRNQAAAQARRDAGGVTDADLARGDVCEGANGGRNAGAWARKRAAEHLTRTSPWEAYKRRIIRGD